jgi:hypothetical protein
MAKARDELTTRFTAALTNARDDVARLVKVALTLLTLSRSRSMCVASVDTSWLLQDLTATRSEVTRLTRALDDATQSNTASADDVARLIAELDDARREHTLLRGRIDTLSTQLDQVRVCPLFVVVIASK